MKLSKLNIAILAATCAGLSGTALANSYKSYPMIYMTKPDTSEKTLNFVGLIEPMYMTNTNDKAGSKSINDFNFDRLRFGFNGSYSEKLDFFFMSEWAPNTITRPSGGGAQSFLASATFKDVIGTTNIGVGSMVVPMGLSYMTPTTHIPWITYADIEYNLYGANSINNMADIDGFATNGQTWATNIWKPGIMVFDQYNLNNGASLTYTAGVYNTTGTTYNDKSTSQKDFNGSLEYKQGNLLAMYGTRIGYATGVTGAPKEDRSRVRHAATLVYNDFKKDKWWLWGEYMHATDERESGVKDLTADGFFVAAGFRPIQKLELVARHSQFDRDKDTKKTTRSVNSVMVNYTRDDGIRIQTQYNMANEDNWAAVAGTVYPDDTFTMRFSVPLFAKLK